LCSFEKNQSFAIVRASETSKDLPNFKQFPEFAVIASGARTKEVAQRLCNEAKISKKQPIAVLRNHGTPDQTTEIIEAKKLGDLTLWPQDIVVIGKTVEASKDLSWFEAKKTTLKGQKIGYLWPAQRSGKIHSFLNSLGAEATEIPLVTAEPITIHPPALDKFDALVFPLAEIVAEFFGRVEVPQDKIFFAMGPEAQYALEQQGFSAKMPMSYTPRGLASVILSSLPERGRILIVSVSNFPETLRESLSSTHIVWEINLHNVQPVDTPPDFKTCSALVVDSTSVVEPLSTYWGQVSDKIVISAGSTITRALFEKGLSPTLEAKNPSPIGIIYSLMDHLYRTT
ncbi:MAG: uroporphyrinogen-III synthase, partial [Candidatus Hodarchaeota archaeon]